MSLRLPEDLHRDIDEVEQILRRLRRMLSPSSVRAELSLRERYILDGLDAAIYILRGEE